MLAAALFARRGGFLLGLLPDPLSALPTQSFQVSASVVAGCQIEGGGLLGTLDFGTHAGIANQTVNATLVANPSLNIACTPGTALTMSIDGGAHYSDTRNLNLLNGSVLIPYRLFTHAGYAPGGEIMVNQNLALAYNDGDNIRLPIYGQLQLNGFSQAGTYTDTLTVTLSW